MSKEDVVLGTACGAIEKSCIYGIVVLVVWIAKTITDWPNN